jgi:hypothetical protein
MTDKITKEGDGEMLIRLGIDGRLWGKEFCERYSVIDEEIMIAWFSNAIMAGYDKASLKMESEIEAEGKRGFEAGRVDKHGIIPSTTGANLLGLKYDTYADYKKQRGDENG